MLKIVITETFDTEDDGADLLEFIAQQLREGFTSGFYPHWTLDEAPPESGVFHVDAAGRGD